ncbi:MAG TPA: hypothetical protein VF891_04240 [Gaiellaceae bacterium]
MGQLDVEPVEILLLQRDVAALLDLEAADDVIRVDGLPIVPAYLLVGDRGQVLLVEEVETQLLGRRGRKHPHGHADEPEGDGPAPDRPHGGEVPAAAGVSTRVRSAKDCLKEGSYLQKSFSTQRGGRLFGPVFRPEVVLGSGEKAVDVVERRRPSRPKSYRKLLEAIHRPPLTQA